jgi:hypothetical protein
VGGTYARLTIHPMRPSLLVPERLKRVGGSDEVLYSRMVIERTQVVVSRI